MSKPVKRILTSIIFLLMLLISPLILAIALCGIPHWYIFSKTTPTQYPNSKLVSEHTGLGSGGGFTSKIYQTTDPIEQVMLFAEKDMPGFEKIDEPDKGKLVYYNHTHYDGWVTFLHSDVSESYSAIWIYPTPDESGVIVEVLIGWKDERYR